MIDKNESYLQLQLKSLKVKGCKVFQEETLINFCDDQGKPRPVTVLAGANGSGKTTVLELIIALAELLNRPSWSPVANAAPSKYLREQVLNQVPDLLKNTQYAKLNWCIENTRSLSLAYGVLPTKKELADIGLYTQPPQIHTTAFAIDIQQQINTQRDESLPLFSYSKLKTLGSERIELIPSILYLPYYRGILPTKGDQINRENTSYQWIYHYKTATKFTGSVNSYLVWLDYAEPETFAQVCQFLNNLNFDGKTFGINRKELEVIVTTRNGKKHSLAELSSGEQSILVTLLELRRRLLPYSLVLIDEIENSLHPAFQHSLAQGLLKIQKEIPFQLIVTTHSPEIVKIFGHKNTLLLTEF